MRITQTRHAFSFGANGFMVGGFADAARNAAWEAAFARLFNVVTVPFYWRDYEPTPGAYRIDDTSPPLYRRPPAERVLAFAARWGLDAKGHVLLWNQPDLSTPAYWPQDNDARIALIAGRAQQLASRFGSRIGTWDIVNEVMHSSSRFPASAMPPDYPAIALDAADDAFPDTATLLVNEATPEAWDEIGGEGTPYYLLLRSLIARGKRVDAIGLQMHYFAEQELADSLAGKLRTPEQLFAALDLYARLERPLHVTEITVPTLPEFGGAEVQAAMTRNLYRLWFSHPKVEAITWWNLADGTAFAGEDRWNGGLLEKDSLRPKPAYLALDGLINGEWRSDIRMATDDNGQAQARLFHGDYRIEVESSAGRWTDARSLVPGDDGNWLIQLP
ncbi:endo-1,4-beta-xylanase [Sphingomonas sp. CJ99]